MSGPGSLRARVLVAANLRAQQDKRHAYQRPSYAKEAHARGLPGPIGGPRRG